MKLLLLFTLLSFACYGQQYSLSPDGDTIGIYIGRQMIPSGNIMIGAASADDITTGTSSIPLGVDTPQTDRNPHDFYSDTVDADYFINTGNAFGVSSTDKYPVLKMPPVSKVLSLEEKLLLYAQECYNDSTLGEKQYHKTSIDTATCQRNVGFGNVAYYGACEKQSHYYRKYIHRKPTFEGFIEWLRKNK